MSKRSQPQDPNVQPEGYTPPTSAEELLERYAAGERYFEQARLARANLRGADLRGVNLSHADLSSADLAGAEFCFAVLDCTVFDDASLPRSDFLDAKGRAASFKEAMAEAAYMMSCALPQADFTDANLNYAMLAGANLSCSRLQGTELIATNLHGARFDGAHLDAYVTDTVLSSVDLAAFVTLVGKHDGAPTCVIDEAALRRTASGLRTRPERIGTVESFLVSCGFAPNDLPWRATEGLTLYFSTRATPLDRFIIDGVIYGTLGLDTDCQVVQFEQRDGGAILRLQAGKREDLEAIADGLWSRVWESIDQRVEARAPARPEAKAATLAQLGDVLQLTKVGPALSDLVDRIERLHLRSPGDDAANPYETCLMACRRMAWVMERAPGSFATMGEEDLRHHFLAQLAAEPSWEVTGESHNVGGKTDILIRRDGQNLFIAECKVWSGEKALLEGKGDKPGAIDQLLGYLTWRDTKVALIVFSRNRGFTAVLGKIRVAIAKHGAFLRWEDNGVEGEFRCVLALPGDRSREVTMTVLAFDLPVGKERSP